MKKIMVVLTASVFVLMLWAMGPAPAEALLTVSAGTGSLSARADFDVSGSTLIVILTNTSTADVLAPTGVLTAVFFDLVGVGALTPVSAILNTESTVLFQSPQPDGGNVGGEWAYGYGLVGAPGGATEGISSTGLGLFGAANFDGPDLGPPAAIDGLNYGITSAGDNPATGNKPVTGKDPLIKNSVMFTLGLPTAFTLNGNGDISIENVSFQYGTSLTEPNTQVPEPATLLLLGSGLIGVGVMGRRFRKQG